MRVAALTLGALALLVAGGPAAAQFLPRLPGGGSPAAPRTDTETKPPVKEVKPSLPSYRIGALLPLSGVSAWFGKELRQGMELAVEELNRPRKTVPRVDGAGVPGEDQKVSATAQRANEALGPSPGVTL